ncbi:hypothetical protein [Erythrobacter litoralis]|uniref:Lipoprotein n=1 Tax=Erythrobacter litoralis (strain HTCC2594) TaxID=314225 RepID=Q2N8X6_ERYLH|nr:hypothetical protein [Erythrobacter litoralis]ABC63865.1 hypothetical protein ELI_08865 [Erythrobacter litoralis HTCC2594]
MRIVLPVIAALALAACGSETSGTLEGEDGERMDYSVDENSGETNATITTEDGTATMQTGPNVRARLPLGFKVYPGATVLSATNIDSDGEKGSLVMMETNATPDEIIAYYKAEAEAAGIDIKMDMTTGESRALAGEGASGASFSVNAGEQGSATSVQLMVSEGSGN